tara:strand:+ start:1480 stop:2973 length:1494 start_codon:yes stop_codon:yes gene_type:complete
MSSSIAKSSLLARNIAKDINKDNLAKSRAIKDDSSFFAKRRQFLLRKKREEEIEASTPGNLLKKQGNVIKSTAKGFLGRVLNFFGITLLGWLVTSLPAIIKGIQGLIKRITDLVLVLKSFVNKINDIFFIFGRKLDETSDQLEISELDENAIDIKKKLEESGLVFSNLNLEVNDAVREYEGISEDLDNEAKNIVPSCPEGMMWSENEGQCVKDPNWWDKVYQFMYLDRRTEDGDEEEDDNEVLEYNIGGIVKGPGGIDNVPAKLTAGEFIMSKKAVDKWGVSFFESLNAMSGANNTGSIMGGFEEGGVVEAEDLKNTLVSNQNKITKEKEIAAYEKKLADAEIRLEQYIIDDDAKRKSGVNRFINHYKNVIRYKKNELEEIEEKLEIEKSRQIIEATVGSKNLEGTKKILKDTAEEIEPIVKSAEFENLKRDAKEIVGQISGSIKKKRIIIPLPDMSGGENQASCAVPKSHSVPVGGMVNSTKSLYKKLTTLVTSYT